MATATATAELPMTGLAEKRRAALVAGLNGNLAQLIDLALDAKQAHWNVRGPNFQGLHAIFDAIASDVREYADEIAERAVAIGGVAQGTLQSVAGASALPAFPAGQTNWRKLTIELHDRVLAAAEQIRKGADDSADDTATQDVYVEVLRGLDKWAWMLRAHLQD